MIFRLQIDKALEESITAMVHERTALVDEIERLVTQENIKDQLPGYLDDEIRMLTIRKIECFFAESDKTYAVYGDGRKYQVRKKLYELEQMLPDDFERINRSAIANWKKIAKFKVQLSGGVDAVFACGYTDYISRRCFSELRKRYDL